jgi:hypothetical protein
MDLSQKTLYFLHDGDSYEVDIDNIHGAVRAIWRYRGNRTSKPEFCRLDALDDILQDRIHDKLTRFIDNGQECT